jgi:uncharacterized protein YecT (DUF1311 family)
MKVSVFCAIALLSGAAAHADPASECGTGLGSQVEIADCVADIEMRVDASLSTMLGFVNASAAELDEATGRKEAVPALDAAQAAWSAYRDSHCEYVGTSFGGGSGTGIAIRSCRIELGRAREAELEAMLR